MPETHTPKCNGWAAVKRLKISDFVLPLILTFQEFLYGEENAAKESCPRGDQDWGPLKRYILIPKRLIFESRVRAGSPSLAAAPAAPEIRPRLSVNAASIISFSCLSSAPVKATFVGTWGVSRLSQLSS